MYGLLEVYNGNLFLQNINSKKFRFETFRLVLTLHECTHLTNCSHWNNEICCWKREIIMSVTEKSDDVNVDQHHAIHSRSVSKHRFFSADVCKFLECCIREVHEWLLSVYSTEGLTYDKNYHMFVTYLYIVHLIRYRHRTLPTSINIRS